MFAELQSGGKGDLRILVTGRTGAGKSALVNSIVGEYVADEGDLPTVTTGEVTKYTTEKVVNETIESNHINATVTIAIYDSPGLQDGIEDKRIERRYLRDLEEKCKEVDLNLYCVKINGGIRVTEEEAMKKLSQAFGMDNFWKNTLIVLTFANEVRPPRSSSTHPVDYFSQRMLQWKTALRRMLIEESHITKEVAENVPIVPAGYSDELSLPAAGYDDWLSKLWLQCLKRTRDIAKPVLLTINWKRLMLSDKVKEAEDIRKKNKKGYELPIIPDHTELSQILQNL